MQPLGSIAPRFSLPDPEGRVLGSDDFSAAPALLVVFLSNHCPFVHHIRREFASFAREYRERGLAVVAIGSNDVDRYPADGPEAMAREVREQGYTFPYLHDATQEVAKSYGAACTPDFFLYDGERRLAYRGQFDGSRPGNEIAVTGEDLRRAADAVLAGRTVPGEQRPSIGCNIKWKPGNEPAWFGA